MNVRNTKRPEKRLERRYEQRFGLQSYGVDNLYPQNVADIVGASGTAVLCLNRYAKFVEGYGFENDTVFGIEVNRYGDTMDDLLGMVSQDVAMYGGFALHVNYNVLGEVSEVQHVPYEQCRLEEVDDAGYVARILLHPDWKGDTTRNGHRVSVTEEEIKRIDVFNPNAVLTQMENAGGAEQYNGQILWCSMDGMFRYPVPIYDAAVTEISTDEGLGNIKYRNVRNNFLVACMLIAKKGIPKIDDEGREEERQMIADEDLRNFQGDERGSKIMYVELENDEDEPKVVEFPVKNYDKDFAVTDESVVERIYAQFHQELFYAIRMGKLGFSGNVMRDAYEYYAGEVTTEQRFIERNFAKVFANWKDGAITQFRIQPLKYISSEDNA